MKLRELLERTNDGAQQTISGAFIVHPSTQSRSDYWHLEDYKVSSASAYNIWLVPVKAGDK